MRAADKQLESTKVIDDDDTAMPRSPVSSKPRLIRNINLANSKSLHPWNAARDFLSPSFTPTNSLPNQSQQTFVAHSFHSSIIGPSKTLARADWGNSPTCKPSSKEELVLGETTTADNLSPQFSPNLSKRLRFRMTLNSKEKIETFDQDKRGAQSNKFHINPGHENSSDLGGVHDDSLLQEFIKQYTHNNG